MMIVLILKIMKIIYMIKLINKNKDYYIGQFKKGLKNGKGIEYRRIRYIKETNK